MSYQDQGFNGVEQDRGGVGDELPTYDDLAASQGPNSRFGRWQGWIEKRAAERYHGVTPEERERRRQRGWGNDQDPSYQAAQQNLAPSQAPPPPLPPRSINVPTPMITREPPTPQPALQIRTVDLLRQESIAEAPPETPPMPALPFLPQRLKPSHLKMFNFGSRFLPHSTVPIRCLLPILSDRLILIGHDEGLSVLDLYPQRWDNAGHIVQRGPDEAQARTIWTGEGVFQMTVLEAENTGDGRPQGVVLALVGPPATQNHSESVRSLRMYNLSSLISLAKWAVANKGPKPLDLARPSHWSAQSTPTKKRHRPTSSIAKSIQNFIERPKQDHAEPSSSSYHNLLSPSATRTSPNPLTSNKNGRSSPSPSLGSLREAVEAIDGSPTDPHPHSPTRGDSWDLVDELPLRWATDFVPLASPGSRLLHASILSYALWKDEHRKGTGGQLLAVSTKSNILLYETPRGERAFHFVKEFYTPLTPRSITFFQQAVHEMARSSSDSSKYHKHGHGRSNSGSSMHVTTESPRAAHTIDYGIHTSLFVVFEKKAGWIRLADSAVGEWDLWDDPSTSVSLHSNSSVASTASRRSRVSVDYSPHHPKWIPPTRVHLELGEGRMQDLYLLTRGLGSHLLPCPLPTHPLPPLHAMMWQSPPASVVVRLCGVSEYDEGDDPFLQVIASGDDGVEVREIPLAALMTKGKGKGKARPVEERTAFEDLGGGAALMCRGGHWDNPERAYYSSTMAQGGFTSAMSPPGLSGGPSPGGLRYSASMSSTSTYGSVDTEIMLRDLKREEGVYGVCRKGLEDWRVFWVGGSAMYEDDDDDEPLGDL